MEFSRRELLKTTGVTIALGGGVAATGAAAGGPLDVPEMPAAASNYSNANRDAGDVRWIVIHVSQGSFRSGVNVFQRPGYGASSQYFVRTSDGYAVQMVDDEDVAWHAGNGPYNDASIGIEHSGYVDGTDFSSVYDRSARLVAALCRKYDVPVRRPGGVAPCNAYDGAGGIVGHDQVPDPDNCAAGGGAARHGDPGPNWDWDRYMRLVRKYAGEGGLEDGTRVKTTGPTTVRSSAEVTDSNVKVTVETGSTGGIANGPHVGKHFTWYWVVYDQGVGGWSPVEKLDVMDDSGGGSGGDRKPSGDGDIAFDSETDLRRTVAVTGAQIDDAIRAIRPDSPLIGLGDAWVATQEKYGINALYQAAHAAHESAWGTSDIAQEKRNLYGYDARDACPARCADGYDSFRDCIRTVMPVVDQEYLTDGGDHYHGSDLQGMNVEYATDPRWAEKIADTVEDLTDRIDVAYEDETGPEFPANERVATTRALPVRRRAEPTAPVNRRVDVGATGYVRRGPVSNGGTTWYQVEFNAGFLGWVPVGDLESSPRFARNRRVALESGSTVKTTPGTGGTTAKRLSEGAAGYVRADPQSADGDVWYRVAFNAGVRGWVKSEWLAPAARFDDDRVATTAETDVRGSASFDGSVRTTLSDGAAGYVRGGPKSADGETWYDVAFNTGHRGWVLSERLEPALLKGRR